MGLLVHDQGAEVPRVEHDDVGGLGGHIEHHEGADQDAETAKVDMLWLGLEKNIGFVFISTIYRRYKWSHHEN